MIRFRFCDRHVIRLADGSDIQGSYGVILNNRMITMARAVRRKVLAPQRLFTMDCPQSSNQKLLCIRWVFNIQDSPLDVIGDMKIFHG